MLAIPRFRTKNFLSCDCRGPTCPHYQTRLGPSVTPPSPTLPILSTSSIPDSPSLPVPTSPPRCDRAEPLSLPHQDSLSPSAAPKSISSAALTSDPAPALGNAFDKLDPVEVEDGSGVSSARSDADVEGRTEATARNLEVSRASSSIDRSLERSSSGGRRSSTSD